MSTSNPVAKPSEEGLKRDKYGPSLPVSTRKTEPNEQPISGCKEQFLFPIFNFLRNPLPKIHELTKTPKSYAQKKKKKKTLFLCLKLGFCNYAAGDRRAKTKRSPSLMSSNTLQPSQVNLEFWTESL